MRGWQLTYFENHDDAPASVSVRQEADDVLEDEPLHGLGVRAVVDGLVLLAEGPVVLQQPEGLLRVELAGPKEGQEEVVVGRGQELFVLCNTKVG